MNILQINNVYNRLSTGKIVADLHHAYINHGDQSYICYGRGPIESETNVFKTCWELYAKLNKLRARVTGFLYGGCSISTIRLIKKIEEIQPDVVHLHCINDNFVNVYELLEYLKKEEIPTVVTLHAEFFYTGSCGYSYNCTQWQTE